MFPLTSSTLFTHRVIFEVIMIAKGSLQVQVTQYKVME